MAERNTHGGGAFIALGSIAGTVGGSAWGQPSAGLLAGLGAGVLAAVLIWLRDRTVR